MLPAFQALSRCERSTINWGRRKIFCWRWRFERIWEKVSRWENKFDWERKVLSSKFWKEKKVSEKSAGNLAQIENFHRIFSQLPSWEFVLTGNDSLSNFTVASLPVRNGKSQPGKFWVVKHETINCAGSNSTLIFSRLINLSFIDFLLSAFLSFSLLGIQPSDDNRRKLFASPLPL